MEMYAEGRCSDYRLQYASTPPSVAALQLHLQTLLASGKDSNMPLWTPPNQVLCRRRADKLYACVSTAACLQFCWGRWQLGALQLAQHSGCGEACGAACGPADLQRSAGLHAYLPRIQTLAPAALLDWGNTGTTTALLSVHAVCSLL